MKANILVVEDHTDVRNMIKRLIERMGHTVTTSGSAEEALTLPTKAPFPDLIITDLNMPGKSGLDLIRHLRARPETSRIPMVLATTDSSLRDVPELTELHMGFLSKPFQIDELEQVVTTSLKTASS